MGGEGVDIGERRITDAGRRMAVVQELEHVRPQAMIASNHGCATRRMS